MRKIVFIAVGLFVLISACNTENSNNPDNQDKDAVNVPVENTVHETLTDSISAKTDEKSESDDDEYTAKYICPNHDKGSGSNEPGDCPVCGMELIENPNYQGK